MNYKYVSVFEIQDHQMILPHTPSTVCGMCAYMLMHMCCVYKYICTYL